MTEKELLGLEWEQTGKILACDVDNCGVVPSGYLLHLEDGLMEITWLCHKHHSLALNPPAEPVACDLPFGDTEVSSKAVKP